MAFAADMPDDRSSAAKRLSKGGFAFSVLLAILLIFFGCLAIFLPAQMSMGVVIVVSWLLMFSGIVQFIDAFRGPRGWHIAWEILVGIAYFVTGLYLRFNLGIGLAALTLALILFFVVHGVIDIFVFFRTRKSGASGWVLLHGICSFILGLMIWRHWPSGALWVIGTLVGISMIMTGTTRLMLAFAFRRAERLITREAS